MHRKGQVLSEANSLSNYLSLTRKTPGTPNAGNWTHNSRNCRQSTTACPAQWHHSVVQQQAIMSQLMKEDQSTIKSYELFPLMSTEFKYILQCVSICRYVSTGLPRVWWEARRVLPTIASGRPWRAALQNERESVYDLISAILTSHINNIKCMTNRYKSSRSCMETTL